MSFARCSSCLVGVHWKRILIHSWKITNCLFPIKQYGHWSVRFVFHSSAFLQNQSQYCGHAFYNNSHLCTALLKVIFFLWCIFGIKLFFIVTPDHRMHDSFSINYLTLFSFSQHLAVAKDCDSDSLRRYSWTADAMDNVNLVSSPIHSGLVTLRGQCRIFNVCTVSYCLGKLAQGFLSTFADCVFKF